MARSHESFSDGEAVLYESRLHWVALFKEILFTALALGILLWFLLGWQPAAWIYWLLLGGWAISCFRGVSNWFTTTVTLTNRRLIVRRGLLSKAGWELPVDRVLDVAFRQSLLQRMVGSGDLLVESAANTDRNTLHNVVRPTEVKRLISEARESVEERRVGRVSSAGQGPSRAEQLETLSRLHQQGSLTDAEFEAEKQRLLAQG